MWRSRWRNWSVFGVEIMQSFISKKILLLFLIPKSTAWLEVYMLRSQFSVERVKIKNSRFIFRSASIICATKNSIQISVSKSLHSFHNTLMTSYDYLKIILFQKIFYTLCSKFDHFSLCNVISLYVVLILRFIHIRNWVRPKYIKHQSHLLILKIFVVNFVRFFYLVQIVDISKVFSYARMHA